MPTRLSSRVIVRSLLVLLALAAVLAVGQPAALSAAPLNATCPNVTRLYVNASVSGGTGDGLSWANASRTLTAALTTAQSCPNVTEVWVARGTYKPAGPNGDRNATFQLRNNLAVYGGFTAGQSSLGQRNANPATNGTVLSGDLNGDDGPSFANNGENSLHVVTGSHTENTAILDGFTVSGGNTDGIPNFDGFGGGMVNDSGSPTVTNVTFSGNSAARNGGGMFNYSDDPQTHPSNPTLTNVTFSGNTAGGGGGMDNEGSSPTLTNVTFSGNTAGDGGGMLNEGSSPTLTNVTFSGNTAVSGGGGMFNTGGSPTLTNVTFSGNTAGNVGGGMYNYGGRPTLTNITFSGNSAQRGGGMFNHQISNPTLTNVTFSGNSATHGGGLFNDRSNSTLTNCILWGDLGGEIDGSATVTYSIVQQASGVYPGTGNLNADPKFVVPITAPAPTTTGNLRLKAGSPAINVGSNAAVPAGVTTDPDGAPRIVSGTVDMGAYEYQPYTASGVSPTQTAATGVNHLAPSGLGPWTTPVRWKLTDGAGAAVTTAGTVAAVKYTPMACGGPTPSYDSSFPTAGGFSSTNPTYDPLQKAWVFNWQLPGRNACYALYVKLTNGQALTFLYNVH